MFLFRNLRHVKETDVEIVEWGRCKYGLHPSKVLSISPKLKRFIRANTRYDMGFPSPL
jgi:hypothetical protein